MKAEGNPLTGHVGLAQLDLEGPPIPAARLAASRSPIRKDGPPPCAMCGMACRLRVNFVNSNSDTAAAAATEATSIIDDLHSHM